MATDDGGLSTCQLVSTSGMKTRGTSYRYVLFKVLILVVSMSITGTFCDCSQFFETMLWKVATKTIPPESIGSSLILIKQFQMGVLEDTFSEFIQPVNFHSCCTRWYNQDPDDQNSRSHAFGPYTIHHKCEIMLPSFMDCIQGDLKEVLQNFFITTYVKYYLRYPDSNIVPQVSDEHSRISLLGKRIQTNDFGSPPYKQARFEEVYVGQESDNDSVMEDETTNQQPLDPKPILSHQGNKSKIIKYKNQNHYRLF
ncbi:hypothetical protein RF11_10187 [Thelohanellus kitauei]|uniref:Uncharacterized protein n=1 Tax=Thelohanellus kitauei TaxID=669202 RepID=A0A0C2J3G1_THEKT|nr:hypothetical protein RF11_10187 [Thelohanellus kitauei]